MKKQTNKNVYKLEKKGSSKSSFYLQDDLPDGLEDILRNTLILKGVDFKDEKAKK